MGVCSAGRRGRAAVFFCGLALLTVLPAAAHAVPRGTRPIAKLADLPPQARAIVARECRDSIQPRVDAGWAGTAFAASLGAATLFALPCGTAASNQPFILLVERGPGGPVEKPELRYRDKDGSMQAIDPANVSWDGGAKTLTAMWGAGADCTGTYRWRWTGRSFEFLSHRRTRGCSSE